MKCWACDKPGIHDLYEDGRRLYCQEHWDYAIDVAKHNCSICGFAATFKTVGGDYRCTPCNDRMFEDAARRMRQRVERNVEKAVDREEKEKGRDKKVD